MKPDPTRHYNMPLSMGAQYDRQRPPRLEMKAMESLAFQYLTEPETIAELLPEHYHPGKEPLVTVLFTQNQSASFLAQAGYRSAAVLVEARFDGRQDHVTGDYCLMMFANQVGPILSGREDAGLPALFAEISPIKLLPDGHLRCEASFGGFMLFGLDVPPLKSQLGVLRVMSARQVSSRPWLGHKYIPSLDGPPDADYPTLVKIDVSVKKLATGKRASLRFGTARAEDIQSVKLLVDTLATLTIIKPVQVLHYSGTAVDRLDLRKRLK